MIRVREATGNDVAAIRDIFLASYGTDYTDPRYYDELQLTRLVYSEDSLLLVAEETETGQVIGTGSLEFEIGAHSDLVGEFCRMAVHPAFRNRGVGNLLLSERIARVEERLQIGLIEARVAHPYTMKIAEKHRFAVVGFLPMVWQVGQRESLSLFVRFFSDALELRNSHPRLIPEAYSLAHLALTNCSLKPDLIVDEDLPAYPPGGSFQLQELTSEGYAPLLRIERGRVRHREIFGPGRLHYGIFKLRATDSRYLIAREDGRIAGAVGFTVDPLDKSVRIFELIALHDGVIRFLLSELLRESREKWGSGLVEVDVSAYAPRMQRTLLELGFLPVSYIPALVFHEVERLDVVKMMRMLTPPHVSTEGLTPRCKAIAELVLNSFRVRSVLPQIGEAVQLLVLFAGLDSEQISRLAGMCSVAVFQPGDVIFREGEIADRMHIILDGAATITNHDSALPVGEIRKGECLGEISFLTAAPHSATATARARVETAVLEHQGLGELIRLRPDIGLHVYRNLACGMGEKLKRLNKAFHPLGFDLTRNAATS
jgi:N-acetylglutamate synthase-like GNAT family acetyltransferase